LTRKGGEEHAKKKAEHHRAMKTKRNRVKESQMPENTESQPELHLQKEAAVGWSEDDSLRKTARRATPWPRALARDRSRYAARSQRRKSLRKKKNTGMQQDYGCLYKPPPSTRKTTREGEGK